MIKKGTSEKTILFGSESSRMLLRIYDKTMERTYQLGSGEGVPGGWVRLEYQLRDEAADSFIRSWREAQNISTVYFGMMNNQLRFVKKRDERNSSRSENTSWWNRFLGYYGKIKMAYPGGLEYNLQDLEKYLFRQAGSSIRTWLEMNQYDTSQFIELVKHKKLNDRQEHLLDMSRRMSKAGS